LTDYCKFYKDGPFLSVNKTLKVMGLIFSRAGSSMHPSAAAPQESPTPVSLLIYFSLLLEQQWGAFLSERVGMSLILFIPAAFGHKKIL
jgi:hypothetical protein